MVDAFRMEVNTAAFVQHLTPLLPPKSTYIDPHSFDDMEAGQRFVLFGSGADKLVALFSGDAQVDVIAGFKNSASYLSQLAYQAYLKGEFADVAYFEPYYLKDFVATKPKQRT